MGDAKIKLKENIVYSSYLKKTLLKSYLLKLVFLFLETIGLCFKC